MATDHPYRCSRCEKIVHAPSKRFAKCCNNATLFELANFCFLMPKQSMPTNTVVAVFNKDLKDPDSTGIECVTPCNAKTKPRFTTGFIGAVTCKKCLEWFETRKLIQSASKEKDFIIESLKGVTFEDEDDAENSFVSKVEDIKKIDMNLLELKEVQQTMGLLKELRDNEKFRKIMVRKQRS